MKICVLPGDGIGPEIIGETLRMLEAMRGDGVKFEAEMALVGGAAVDATGKPLPEETVRLADEADALLLGAVGGPKWDAYPREQRPELGLLGIRRQLKLFANLRPAILYPELANASSLKPEIVAGLDILIVRELTGDIYFGQPRGIEMREVDGLMQRLELLCGHAAVMEGEGEPFVLDLRAVKTRGDVLQCGSERVEPATKREGIGVHPIKPGAGHFEAVVSSEDEAVLADGEPATQISEGAAGDEGHAHAGMQAEEVLEHGRGLRVEDGELRVIDDGGERAIEIREDEQAWQGTEPFTPGGELLGPVGTRGGHVRRGLQRILQDRGAALPHLDARCGAWW